MIEIGGRRILDRVTDLLTQVTGVLPHLIANAPDADSWLSDVPVVRDRIVGAGVLGGIHAALTTGGSSPVLCVAWDMPYLTAPLLTALIEGSGPFEAYLPESDGPKGLEPACAVYRPSCAGAIEQRIARGDVRAIAFHSDVRVGTLSLARVRTFGDPARLFFNVNSPEDVERAERAWPPPG